MFKFLVNEEGARRAIDLYPQPVNLRERFVFWLLGKFSPRTTIVVVSDKVRRLLDNEGAREEWRQRMTEWNSQRLEDVSVLELSINETTGAFE
jgi:hypothetical protein